MKIESNAAQQALTAYRDRLGAARGGNAPQGTDAPAPQQAPDRAEISDDGRRFAQALDAVRAAPDTRGQLVASLRDQVQSGAYTVDGKKLAATLARHIDVGA